MQAHETDHEHVTPELNISDIIAAVDVDSKRVHVTVSDNRAGAAEEFGRLAHPEMEALAEDIWRVGFNAVTKARTDALSTSIEKHGEDLMEGLGRLFEGAVESTADAINDSIGKWFDPNEGSVSKDIRDAIGPEGDLERILKEAVGEGGVAEETINRICGPGSPIFDMMNPEARNSVVSAIEGKVAEAMDPLNKKGAGRRFLDELRSSLDETEEDRGKQLAQLTSALDANNPKSAISRLLKDMNPAIKGSALNGMREEILAVLGDFSKKQGDQNDEIISRLSAVEARFETRREERERAPVGGNDFEEEAYAACVDLLEKYAVSVTHTGSQTGSIARCKEGDIVIQFDNDHSQSGGRVVIETKREAKWNEQKALEAIERAMQNRESQIGIFLLAESRAPRGFPRFKRVGNRILATWDPEDQNSNFRLEAYLICALGLVRPVSNDDDGSKDVVLSVIASLEKEASRSDDFERWARTIVRNGEKIVRDSAISRKKLRIAKEGAKSLLSIVGAELDESEISL